MSSIGPVRQPVAILGLTLALAADLSAATQTLSAPEALAKVQAGEITLIDIRTPSEWRQTGVPAGALTIDMTGKTFVDELLKAVQGNRSAPIVLICRTGNRTSLTLENLKKQGFSNVSHIPEGIAGSGAGPGWMRRGLPVERCQHC